MTDQDNPRPNFRDTRDFFENAGIVIKMKKVDKQGTTDFIESVVNFRPEIDPDSAVGKDIQIAKSFVARSIRNRRGSEITDTRAYSRLSLTLDTVREPESNRNQAPAAAISSMMVLYFCKFYVGFIVFFGLIGQIGMWVCCFAAAVLSNSRNSYVFTAILLFFDVMVFKRIWQLLDNFCRLIVVSQIDEQVKCLSKSMESDLKFAKAEQVPLNEETSPATRVSVDQVEVADCESQLERSSSVVDQTWTDDTMSPIDDNNGTITESTGYGTKLRYEPITASAGLVIGLPKDEESTRHPLEEHELIKMKSMAPENYNVYHLAGIMVVITLLLAPIMFLWLMFSERVNVEDVDEVLISFTALCSFFGTVFLTSLLVYYFGSIIFLYANMVSCSQDEWILQKSKLTRVKCDISVNNVKRYFQDNYDAAIVLRNTIEFLFFRMFISYCLTSIITFSIQLNNWQLNRAILYLIAAISFKFIALLLMVVVYNLTVDKLNRNLLTETNLSICFALDGFKENEEAKRDKRVVVNATFLTTLATPVVNYALGR